MGARLFIYTNFKATKIKAKAVLTLKDLYWAEKNGINTPTAKKFSKRGVILGS